MPFCSCDVQPACELAVDAHVFCFHSCTSSGCALPPLRAVCCDSGMWAYATTCDRGCCSQVSLPEEEKRYRQNLHIRKDLMPGCISLAFPCWLLLCPTLLQPASQPSSPSLLLFSLSLHFSRAQCVAGLVFAAPARRLNWSLDNFILEAVQECLAYCCSYWLLEAFDQSLLVFPRKWIHGSGVTLVYGNGSGWIDVQFRWKLEQTWGTVNVYSPSNCPSVTPAEEKGDVTSLMWQLRGDGTIDWQWCHNVGQLFLWT